MDIRNGKFLECEDPCGMVLQPSTASACDRIKSCSNQSLKSLK